MPMGAFTFGAAPEGWIARVGAMPLAQPFVLLHPVLVPPVQPPEFVHELLSRLRTAASSKLPSGLCAENAAPLTAPGTASVRMRTEVLIKIFAPR